MATPVISSGDLGSPSPLRLHLGGPEKSLKASSLCSSYWHKRLGWWARPGARGAVSSLAIRYPQSTDDSLLDFQPVYLVFLFLASMDRLGLWVQG